MQITSDRKHPRISNIPDLQLVKGVYNKLSVVWKYAQIYSYHAACELKEGFEIIYCLITETYMC